MKLPCGDQALVPEAKIVDYLLSEAHPQGRSKAAFFRRVGFRSEESGALRTALLQLATTTDMTEVVFEFGRKYAGIREVVAPSGEMLRVVTGWVLRNDAPPPMLVTAYPA